MELLRRESIALADGCDSTHAIGQTGWRHRQSRWTGPHAGTRQSNGWAAAPQDRVASTDNGLLPYYHPPGELSTKPQAVEEIRFADAGALADIQSGSLILELFINETGRLDRVRVESGSLPESFQEIVAETFRQALFTPGMKNHVPVKSRLRIEVAVEDVLETTRTSYGGATAI